MSAQFFTPRYDGPVDFGVANPYPALGGSAARRAEGTFTGFSRWPFLSRATTPAIVPDRARHFNRCSRWMGGSAFLHLVGGRRASLGNWIHGRRQASSPHKCRGFLPPTSWGASSARSS